MEIDRQTDRLIDRYRYRYTDIDHLIKIYVKICQKALKCFIIFSNLMSIVMS